MRRNNKVCCAVFIHTVAQEDILAFRNGAERRMTGEVFSRKRRYEDIDAIHMQ